MIYFYTILGGCTLGRQGRLMIGMTTSRAKPICQRNAGINASIIDIHPCHDWESQLAS
jgi:hypothetical protein